MEQKRQNCELLEKLNKTRKKVNQSAGVYFWGEMGGYICEHFTQSILPRNRGVLLRLVGMLVYRQSIL